MVDKRTTSSTGTPWRDRKFLCATARMLYASNAIRPSEIDGRTTHFMTSTVVTKYGNAPSMKFQNEKR